MSIKKQEVISALLATYTTITEKFKALVKIMLTSSISTPAQKRFYNSCGFSKVNLDTLEYDIKKMYSISNFELVITNKQKVSKNKTEVSKNETEVSTNEIELSKNETHLKLKDEFPFLYQENCPNEFKILVNDKFKAYYDYLNAREELKKAVENNEPIEKLQEIAGEAVESFELNHEIYQELDYFKEHKEILGKHPIFAKNNLEETVKNYSTVELTKRQKALRTYISRDTKTLEKSKNTEAKNKITSKLDFWKQELILVEDRLSKIS